MAPSTAKISASSAASGFSRAPGVPRHQRRRRAAYRAEAGSSGWSLRAAIREHSIGVADCVSAGAGSVLVLWAFGGLSGATVAISASVLGAAIFHTAGGHRDSHTKFCRSTLDEIPAILVFAGLLTLLLTIVYPAESHVRVDGWRTGALWAALGITLCFGRMIARAIAGRLIGPERCLVIGTITEARRVQRRLRAAGARAYIVGTVLPSQLGSQDNIEDLREALSTVAADVEADRLIVAAAGHEQADIARLVQVARLEGLELSVSSPLLDAAAAGPQIQHVSGMALLAADPIQSGRVSLSLTRAIDVAFSSLFLLASAPLFATIALAVKLDSPGPVFFRQVRVGLNGTRFRIVKFRSMVTDAEARKASLRGRSEVGAEMFKLADDPRVTRVGRFLRHRSLDELPQLLNVLRGDMTLVGPRPLVVDEDAIIEGVGRGRLQQTPGMTGPWQVLSERVAQAEMLDVDYSYVTNRSLWVDAKILVRTALHVMRNRNV
jgi:exopolysaccharide biosynthesis polyprenyl glycosylphosphotransferase